MYLVEVGTFMWPLYLSGERYRQTIVQTFSSPEKHYPVG